MALGEQTKISAVVKEPPTPITVGAECMFQVGLHVDAGEDASTATIGFNILIHPDGITLTGNREWSLSIDPSRSQTTLVSVPFQAQAVGTARVAIDFYKGLLWLKTLRVSFEITEHTNSDVLTDGMEAA